MILASSFAHAFETVLFSHSLLLPIRSTIQLTAFQSPLARKPFLNETFRCYCPSPCLSSLKLHRYLQYPPFTARN